jgi:hypothetical protein
MNTHVRLLILFFACFTLAYAQRYEITPLVGARYGGVVKLEQQGLPNTEAHLADSISYGIAAGVHIDADDCEGCGLLEFRWMRQDTHFDVAQNPLVPTPLGVDAFRPSVKLDHFLGDFTREWSVTEAPAIRPFATVTLGASRMSAPASSTTRFAFGIGGGLKVFPARNWGFRFQIEYLPTVMHADLQRIVCAGGCVVALSGGLMNQFQISIGPAVRF